MAYLAVLGLCKGWLGIPLCTRPHTRVSIESNTGKADVCTEHAPVQSLAFLKNLGWSTRYSLATTASCSDTDLTSSPESLRGLKSAESGRLLVGLRVMSLAWGSSGAGDASRA